MTKIKLSTHMALISSILIGTIVLFISAFVILFLKDISLIVDSQASTVNKAFSTSIFQVVGKDVDAKNYKNIEKITANAITNNLIAYFIVKDNKTNLIEFSTIKSLTNKNFSTKILTAITANDTKNFTLHKKTNTYYIAGPKKDATMYIGFYSKSLLNQSIENFINSMSFMVVLSIIIGLFLSHILTKIITNPLEQLSAGTHKFAEGDFGHRISYFNYKEIDELVTSYNKMAETLQELYISLENKVAARTRELNDAYKELQNTQSMMVHSEKMKSLGELVAGITHEINNPVNFIYGNLIHLTNYTNDLISLIEKYESCENDLLEEHKQEIEQIKNDIDLAFLKEDLGALIQSCREGTERTKNIILDLKNFSRMEERVLSSIDLTKEIDTTLNILYSKYKNRITIHKEYQNKLPLVESFGGQLNQVFMNILDNAFYAIEETGDVYIRIKQEQDNVIIEFEDNGKGMEQSTVDKIFDPFFTTKPVGKGTGLGMSISYRVIKDHNGKIQVKSEIGKGTTFTITLPTKFVKKEEINTNEQV